MWIKFICFVLLTHPRPVLGIHLFCGSQACSPNHLSSQHPDSQPHVEISAGLEGTPALVPLQWGNVMGSAWGWTRWLFRPLLCQCPRTLAAPWHEHLLTTLTWPYPFFPPFSGCKRKRTWNGAWKHLPEKKINLSVEQNFAVIFSFRSSVFRGVCAYVYVLAFLLTSFSLDQGKC